MENIYQTIYDIFNTYIYGGTVTSGTYQELVCIALATCACVLFAVLPFVVVWRIIRVFL